MTAPTHSRFQVAAVVAFYMCAALVMVFVNKAVLNRAPELPLVFLLNQLLIAVVLLHVAARLTPRVEIPAFEWGTARKLAPCVIVNIVGLVFNTLCLREVDASFFQIARGLQLPLTIFVSALTMCSAPSPRVILAAAMVTAGFFIGVAPSSLLHTYVIAEPPSLMSLTYGVLSSLMIALHAVLIKSALPHVSGSAIQLAYWTNAGSAALVLPFVLFNGELGHVLALSGERTRMFVVGSMVTGVFGFLLCVAGLLSIKVTSPVTHMFSSAARTVLQTLLGVGIFGDLMTVNRAASIFVILLGTLYYTWLKSAPPPAPKADLEARAALGLAKAGPGSPVFDAKWEEKGDRSFADVKEARR